MADNPFTRHKARTVSLTLGLLVTGGLLYLYRGHLNTESLKAFSNELPAVLVVAAFLLLPLCGVPIRIMLVLVGFRFGFVRGWATAAFGLFSHNLAAYYITRGTFREPVRGFLKRTGYAIPDIPAKHRIWFTAAIAAVPGPPFFIKLYLLALTDLPFNIYMGIGAPIYILFSVVPVGIGSAVTDFDMKWVYLLTAAFIATLGLGYGLKRKFSTEELLNQGEHHERT